MRSYTVNLELNCSYLPYSNPIYAIKENFRRHHAAQ